MVYTNRDSRDKKRRSCGNLDETIKYLFTYYLIKHAEEGDLMPERVSARTITSTLCSALNGNFQNHFKHNRGEMRSYVRKSVENLLESVGYKRVGGFGVYEINRECSEEMKMIRAFRRDLRRLSSKHDY